MLGPPPVEPEYWAERRKSVQEGRLENTTPVPSPCTLLLGRAQASAGRSLLQSVLGLEGAGVPAVESANRSLQTLRLVIPKGGRGEATGAQDTTHQSRAPPLHSHTGNTSTVRGPSGLPVLPERLQFEFVSEPGPGSSPDR